MAHGLSCPTACGIFQNRDETRFPGLASRFLTTEPPGMPPSVDSKSFVVLNRESGIYEKGKKKREKRVFSLQNEERVMLGKIGGCSCLSSVLKVQSERSEFLLTSYLMTDRWYFFDSNNPGRIVAGSTHQ